LEKDNITKLEGVQLQDKRAFLEVQVLHHEDIALGLDLEMIPEAVFHSLERFGVRKM
jgi:hypothetical protein